MQYSAPLLILPLHGSSASASVPACTSYACRLNLPPQPQATIAMAIFQHRLSLQALPVSNTIHMRSIVTPALRSEFLFTSSKMKTKSQVHDVLLAPFKKKRQKRLHNCQRQLPEANQSSGIQEELPPPKASPGCSLRPSQSLQSWDDPKLSCGPARPGSSPGPAERHLSSFIQAAR
jgi:hypothetical protein